MMPMKELFQRQKRREPRQYPNARAQRAQTLHALGNQMKQRTAEQRTRF